MKNYTTKHLEVTMSNILGEDMGGNPLYPGDVVLRDGVEETIEFGTYRDKYDCGYVVGYYIPDNCVKLFKGGKDEK